MDSVIVSYTERVAEAYTFDILGNPCETAISDYYKTPESKKASVAPVLLQQSEVKKQNKNN